jgi:quercetin dioxygenase-like cupin family protein
MDRYNWDTIPVEELNPLTSRQVVHTDTMTIAQILAKTGTIVPTHHHFNEQVTMVKTGKVRFMLDGQPVEMQPGDVLRVPPDVPHGLEALEDSTLTELFSPRREDWIRGDDAYLRR